jgi:hypothetical protein
MIVEARGRRPVEFPYLGQYLRIINGINRVRDVFTFPGSMQQRNPYNT